MEQIERTDFDVDGWHIQPSLNRMQRGSESVQVEPKVMQVLLCLAETPGVVISRDTLMEEVWAGTIVHNDVLSRSISELRKIFGDDPKRPHVIETIRSIGYRLICPVSPLASPAPPLLKYKPDVVSRTRIGTGILSGVGLLAFAFSIWWLWPEPASPPLIKPLPVVPVTSNPGHESHPALSPSGAEVAFAWTGTDGVVSNIYRKPLDPTAIPDPVTDHPGTESAPAWSPNGQQLAFVRAHEARCTIVVHTLDTREERALAPCHQNHSVFPSWSPDGTWLAFADRQTPSAPFRIAVVHTQTGEQRFPLDAWTTDNIMLPTFAPQSNRIAFVRSDSEGVWQLYIKDLGTSDPPSLLLPQAGKTLSMAWSPDEQFIVAVMLYKGDYGLWRIQVSTQQASWLPVSANDLTHVSMARHTPQLVYEVSTSDENIWALPLLKPDQVGGTPVRRLASTQRESQPRFSPDGHWIAFQSQRSGNNEVWLGTTDGASPKQLTHFNTAFTWAPAWAPNGAQLAFHAWTDSGTDIYTINPSGNNTTRFTYLQHHERDPRFASDGSGLYFRSNQNGAWDIWYASFDTQEPQAVTEQRGITAFMPYDKALYYTTASDLGVYQLDLTSRQERLLFTLSSSTDYRTWTVVPEGIYFVQRDSTAHLAFFDTETQTTTSLYPVPHIANSSGLSRSPDGRWLLYGQMDQSESDIMLLNCTLQVDACAPLF